MSQHVTAEQIQNLGTMELSQLMLDFASRVHSKCMEHCLDDDKSEYDIHNSIRELMILECNHAAKRHNEAVDHANRFNVPMPEWKRRELKLAEIRARRSGDKK